MNNTGLHEGITDDATYYVCDDTLGILCTYDTDKVPPSYMRTINIYNAMGVFKAHTDLYESLEDNHWTEVGVVRETPDSGIEFVPLSYPSGVLGLTYKGTVDPKTGDIRLGEGTVLFHRVTFEEMTQWAG